MRELTITIRFSQPSLGNVKQPDGSFSFPRGANPDDVLFLASWWRALLCWAAEAVGKRQDAVRQIQWNPVVVGQPKTGARFGYRRQRGERYVVHEQFAAGDLLSVHCLVPTEISNVELIELMTAAGAYRGISPFQPGIFGRFIVENIEKKMSSQFELDSSSDPA